MIKWESRTIFLCTHNLDEADRLCDRLGILKTRLVVLDSSAALRKSVLSRKVVIHLRHVDESLAGAVRTQHSTHQHRCICDVSVGRFNDLPGIACI